MPVEFQRTTRTLGEIAKWKATEFRFFLLYCGIFVMMGILQEDYFNHFVLFHVATRVISCGKLVKIYSDKVKDY